MKNETHTHTKLCVCVSYGMGDFLKIMFGEPQKMLLLVGRMGSYFFY